MMELIETLERQKMYELKQAVAARDVALIYEKIKDCAFTTMVRDPKLAKEAADILQANGIYGIQ